MAELKATLYIGPNSDLVKHVGSVKIRTDKATNKKQIGAYTLRNLFRLEFFFLMT